MKLFRRRKPDPKPLTAADIYRAMLDLASVIPGEVGRDDALRLGRKSGLSWRGAEEVLNEWLSEKAAP